MEYNSDSFDNSENDTGSTNNDAVSTKYPSGRFQRTVHIKKSLKFHI